MSQSDLSAALAIPPTASAAEIHKRFGSTYALRGVALDLYPGRCLGLVGRNGAGKSTLVSIMSGILAPDAGEVLFDGAPAPSLGDVSAWRGRIATVFQHSMVVPGLTVAENVFLGRQPRRGPGIVDWRRMRDQARKVMAEWGFDVDADTPCANLTVEQRQVVEITRSLAAGTRCLLLDEPTSALERSAVQRLFEHVRQLRAAGAAIMYISHHLEEVFEICTDVAVLRDGELVLAAPIAGLTKDDLVAAMVGERKGHDPERAGVTVPRTSVSAVADGPVAGGAPQSGRRKTTVIPDLVVSSVSVVSAGMSLSERLADRTRRRAGGHHRACADRGQPRWRGSWPAPPRRTAARCGCATPMAATAWCGRVTGPGRCGPGSASSPRTGRPRASCRCLAPRRTWR